MTTRTFTALELENIFVEREPELVSSYVVPDYADSDDDKLDVATWRFFHDAKEWLVRILSTPFSGWLHDEYEATSVD